MQNHSVVIAGTERLESVDPGGVIAAAIDGRRVLGSIVYLSTEVLQPGVIRHTEGNRITIGEPDGERSERARAIAAALVEAGLRASVSTHIRQEIWVKLLGNIAFNPISALTGATLVAMARDAEVSKLVRGIMAETESVARKLGIEMPITIDQRIAGAEKVGEQKLPCCGSRSRSAAGTGCHCGRGARTRHRPRGTCRMPARFMRAVRERAPGAK